METNLPDYKLWAVDRANGNQGYVGAGWLDEEGTLSIKLDPFVVLHSNSTIKLYKNIPKTVAAKKSRSRR